jgi:hypothetical protein
MPTYTFSKPGAFDDNLVALMGKVYDLVRLRMPCASQSSLESAARAIILKTTQGERNVKRLCAFAISANNCNVGEP